jgi:hypothetical protein
MACQSPFFVVSTISKGSVFHLEVEAGEIGGIIKWIIEKEGIKRIRVENSVKLVSVVLQVVIIPFPSDFVRGPEGSLASLVIENCDSTCQQGFWELGVFDCEDDNSSSGSSGTERSD